MTFEESIKQAGRMFVPFEDVMKLIEDEERRIEEDCHEYIMTDEHDYGEAMKKIGAEAAAHEIWMAVQKGLMKSDAMFEGWVKEKWDFTPPSDEPPAEAYRDYIAPEELTDAAVEEAFFTNAI